MGANWPFGPKIAYFDVFGRFPEFFDLGCCIPLESVIFFWFFKTQKIKKNLFHYLIEIGLAQLFRIITGTSNFQWHPIWPMGTRKVVSHIKIKKRVFLDHLSLPPIALFCVEGRGKQKFTPNFILLEGAPLAHPKRT